MLKMTAKFFFLTALFSTGCARAQLPLRLLDLKEASLIKNATLIVVGKTSRVDWQTETQPIAWSAEPGVLDARLVRIQLAVEGVIRGSLRKDSITVTFWAAGAFTNGRSLNLPVAGERAIHYLTENDGTIRYVTDIVRSATVLESGYHEVNLAETTDRALSEIAALPVIPGREMDHDAYLRNLGSAIAHASGLIGLTGALPLVRGLLTSEDRQISTAACIQLYRNGFIGQAECLDRLGTSQREDASLHQILKQREAFEPRFKASFLANPLRTAAEYAVLPGDQGISDLLRLLLQYPDAAVARRAQDELKLRGMQ
jgi:hypothetical protein